MAYMCKEKSMKKHLGQKVLRTDIRSSASPFWTMPEYMVTYPSVVIEALGTLYKEYNKAFMDLVRRNREWGTDYQYCGSPESRVNHMVQVDMVGLDDEFLDWATHQSVEKLVEVLRWGKIFEIENSLAAYQIIQGVSEGCGSFGFKSRFRATLDSIRRRFGKQIALLAVTDEKYDGMLAFEFGHYPSVHPTDAEVREYTGFDTFWGPKQFREHVEANGGECKYLLYARTSDPIAKLKNPKLEVNQPLLADKEMRRIIKANSLTMNIDRPDRHKLDEDDESINDTKEYLHSMGMAYRVRSVEVLESLSLDNDVVRRAKPMKGTYGCYGHFRGTVSDRRFLKELGKGIELRGAYVVQPEYEVPKVVDSVSGDSYDFIDRNFLSIDGDRVTFLGGVRNMMPSDSVEAREGRIHGNREMVSAEIICA